MVELFGEISVQVYGCSICSFECSMEQRKGLNVQMNNMTIELITNQISQTAIIHNSFFSFKKWFCFHKWRMNQSTFRTYGSILWLWL